MFFVSIQDFLVFHMLILLPDKSYSSCSPDRLSMLPQQITHSESSSSKEHAQFPMQVAYGDVYRIRYAMKST